MSSKQKKSEKGKTAEAPATEAPSRPSGKAPEAVVSARHKTEMVTRPGRGFSLGELSSAGLAPNLASKWGIRVDVRRRSVLHGNVSALRGWGSQPPRLKKPEGRVKKVEEELVKVEKEVEKEAEELKEEVVKVEKATKKQAARAEKAVKAKVEKQKAKPKKKTKS